MHRRVAHHRWILLGLPLLLACGEDPVLPECDDPFYALRVQARVEGALVVPDRVEAWQGAVLVHEVPCYETECVSFEIPSGTYRIVAYYEGGSAETEAEVENSFACDHEPTDLVVEIG